MTRRALFCILIAGFLLRIVWLDRFPVGFTPDEASFGYDAFSLLNTGKDQWGHIFPLVLESFGDFKPPLYSYLAIPSVALFGLTKFSTRLPNVLFGTLSIYVVFLLTSELFKYWEKERRHKFASIKGDTLALFSAFLLAISPWHIMLSRGAFEANLTSFFLPLGIFLFFRGLSNGKYLLWSSAVCGLNIFSYHSAKLVTPAVILLLILLFKKQLLLVKRKYLHYSILILLFTFSFTAYTFTQGAARRAQDVSIFRGALEEQADLRLAAIEKGMSPMVARLFHNKYRVVARRFIDTYLKFFSVKFLFSTGAGEGTYGMVPGIGVLYWFELPLIVGFLLLLFGERGSRILLLIFFWILVSPVPAGLTMGVGYAANRAACMIPAVQLVSVFGAEYYYGYFMQKKIRISSLISLLTVGLVVFGSFIIFVRDYFLQSPYKVAKPMLSGNLETAYWLSENTKGKLKVFVSRRLSEPHIFIAFANNWDPRNYHIHTEDWERYKDEGHTFLDQLHRYNLGKYVFQTIGNDDLYEDTSSLLVGRPSEFPDGVEIVKVFNYPSGEPAVYVVKPYGELYARKGI